jgi:hypothetical protein
MKEMPSGSNMFATGTCSFRPNTAATEAADETKKLKYLKTASASSETENGFPAREILCPFDRDRGGVVRQ